MTNPGNESIEDYLRNVKARLESLPSDERSAIIDNLEAHIHESLRARRQGADSTPEDVRAVLAEMDPPEAFGSEPLQPPSAAPRPAVGKVALFISLGGLLFAVLMVFVARSHGYIVSLPALLIPQIVALIVAAFSRGDRVGRATIVLSTTILIGVSLLMLLSYSGGQ